MRGGGARPQAELGKGENRPQAELKDVVGMRITIYVYLCISINSRVMLYRPTD